MLATTVALVFLQVAFRGVGLGCGVNIVAHTLDGIRGSSKFPSSDGVVEVLERKQLRPYY